MKKNRVLLTLASLFLFNTPTYAIAPQVISGDVQIVVEGYIVLPTISPVIFPNLTTQNAYTSDTSQTQNYSIQSTFSSKSTTPNVSIITTVDHNHVDQNGAYMVNEDNTGKVYFTLNYQSCGNAKKTYSLITTGTTPLPKALIKNSEVSPESCKKQAGKLFFIRSALKSSPQEQLPPAGTYTGQITLTVEATSES